MAKWHANSNIFRGCTFMANLMNIIEYRANARNQSDKLKTNKGRTRERERKGKRKIVLKMFRELSIEKMTKFSRLSARSSILNDSLRSNHVFHGGSLRNKRRFAAFERQLFYGAVSLALDVPRPRVVPVPSPPSWSWSWSSRYVIIMSGEIRIPRKDQRRSAAAADSPKVILPLMILGCFCVSDMAAMGIIQLNTGPQKCVLEKKRHMRK